MLFFFLSLSSVFLQGLVKKILSMFLYIVTQDACDQYQTNLISLDALKKNSVDVVLFVILNAWPIACHVP